MLIRFNVVFFGGGDIWPWGCVGVFIYMCCLGVNMGGYTYHDVVFAPVRMWDELGSVGLDKQGRNQLTNQAFLCSRSRND